MTLGAFTSGLRALVGWNAGEDDRPCDHRRETRYDFCGHKVILRQRKALGIFHLRDVSKSGASGLTDMPLAVGSVVFLGLQKPHFFAAEVIWTRRMTVGLRWFKPLAPERLDKLHAAHVIQKAARDARDGASAPKRRRPALTA